MRHGYRRTRSPSGRYVNVKRVDECATPCTMCSRIVCRHSAALTFGASIPFSITPIGTGCPLTVSIAGPVTVSGQHLAWLIPLIETGWVAYISTTDAVCYHDGHRSLDAHKAWPDPRSADLRR